MAITIGDAVLYLMANQDGLDKGLGGAERKTKSWAGTVGKLVATGIGAAVLAGGAALAAGAGLIITKAIPAASDLEESINKVDVVFGESGQQIRLWSISAATSLGLTQQQALEAVGTFGNLLTSMGEAPGVSADMSKGLVELSADLASFNNMDPTDVLEKLRAGLTGEAEPLKVLGINLNEASLKAKAAELGFTDLEGTLDPLTKAHAAYALIMEQSANAQGDFGRTSEGLANQQRIFKAQLGDLTAHLGEFFLPIATEVVSFLTANFLPVVETILDVVGAWKAGSEDLNNIISELPGPLQDVVNFLIPVADAIRNFIGYLQSGTDPIAAVVRLVYDLGLAFGLNSDQAQGLATKFYDIYNFVITQLVPGLKQLWTWLGQLWQIAFPALQGAVRFVIDHFNIFGPILGVIAGLLLALNAPILFVVGLAVLLATAWANNWGNIRGKTEEVVNFLGPFIKTAWQGILDVFNWFKGQFELIFSAFSKAFKGDWEGFGEDLRKAWDRAWDLIKTAVSNAVDAIIDYFQGIDWGQVGDDVVQGIADGITSAVHWVIKAVQGLGSAAIAAIKGFLGIHSPARKPKEEVGIPFGQGIGQGIEEQIRAIKGRLTTQMKDLVNITTPSLTAQLQGAMATREGPRFEISPHYTNYQSEGDLREDIRMITMLMGGTL